MAQSAGTVYNVQPLVDVDAWQTVTESTTVGNDGNDT